MTVRFNPPPGWPVPPASWLPGDDWLPDPAWPPPPDDWSWWTVTVRPATPTGPQALGRPGRPSFPARHPRRAVDGVARGALPGAGARRRRLRRRAIGYAAGSAPAAGVRTKAGREYYRPASERAGPDREVAALDPARDTDRALHEIVAACRSALSTGTA